MKFKPTYQQTDVEIQTDEVVYDGFFKMHKRVLRHRKFNGEWSDYMTREMMVRPDAICVLLFDPKQDKILLIEQFRPCLPERESPWLLELVAGMVEVGESDDEVARRESFEEAGVEVQRLKYMMRFVPSPGGLVEHLRMYAGEIDVSKVDLNATLGLDEEHEDIKLHLFDSAEVLPLLEQDIVNASTIMGLQWFMLNKDKLKAEWLDGN
ncbi:ADP-ribose pyrophosphatase [Marinomonas aquimarina]|uniref:ADP-ribose pyrophosphatase n=1 Tax=Marinomonas aquimarina TaxID=295068 RepID=A0A1A8T2W5_9GAMM|nr:NUDIX domain-containing protein [Marinomonas aquimarina]SBS25342.1 ADP-ribose pyrophosphatase [Marinomonas aquimarina]